MSDPAYNQIYDRVDHQSNVNNPMEVRRRLVAPFQISHAEPADDDEEAEEELSNTEMTLNRVILCTFCVIMLWSTSLQNAVYLVSDNVPKPSLTAVYDTCYFTWRFVNRQREDYENCVNSRLRQCDIDFDLADGTEQQRVRVAQEHQANYSRTYSHLVQNCTAYQSNLTDLLRQWQSGGQEYRMVYRDSCSGDQREKIAVLLGDQHDGNAAAITTSSEYTLSSTRRVSRLISYSKDLGSYNAEYIQNKTSSIKLSIDGISTDLSVLPPLNATLSLLTRHISEVKSCLTLDPVLSNQCEIQPSLAEIYNTSRLVLLAQLRSFRKEIDMLEARVEIYRQRVVTAVNAANNFYDSIAGARGLVVWLVQTANLFGSARALCGKGSPDWCDFSKLDWLVPPLTLNPLSPMPTLGDIGQIWAQVGGTVGVLDARLQGVVGEVRTDWGDWVDGVEVRLQGVDVTPRDYNPPSYPGNLSREGDQQQQEADGFLTNLQTSLYSQNQSAQSAGQRIVQGINTTTFPSASTLLSSLRLSWASFTPPSSDLATYLTPLLTLSPLLYTLDYLYRVCSTLRIIMTFWNRGGVRLPAIDRRRKQDKREGLMKNLAWAMRLIPLIWVQVLVLIVAVAVVVLTIVEVIVPSYHSYVDVCVHPPAMFADTVNISASMHQTWLGANVYASAYNYAYGGGNGAIGGGLARFNSRVQERCRGEGGGILGGSRGVYLSTLSTLQQLNQTYADSLEKVGGLFRCVDFSTLSPLLMDSCVDFSSSPAPNALMCPLTVRQRFPPSTLVSLLNAIESTSNSSPNSQSCSSLGLLTLLPDEGVGLGVGNALTGVMEGGMYNCSALPPCKITCPGPDPGLLHRLSHDCSCMVEWAVYSYMAQGSFATLVFVLLNISRLLLTWGLIRVGWRKLARPTFGYLGVVTEKGLFGRMPGAGVAWADERGETQMLVAKVIRAYERVGWVYIVIGVGINCLWVLLLFKVRGNMSYNL